MTRRNSRMDVYYYYSSVRCIYLFLGDYGEIHILRACSFVLEVLLLPCLIIGLCIKKRCQLRWCRMANSCAEIIGDSSFGDVYTLPLMRKCFGSYVGPE